jgi:hypothetical protein
MLDNKLKEDIKTVVEYLWHDEQKHYDADPTNDHIFLCLKRLAKTIKE